MYTWIKEYCIQHKIPALSVTMHKDGKQIMNYNYGQVSLNDHRQINQHSLFGIGSISKLFTAIALLQLQEKGYIHLDDTLQQYIPELNEGISSKITIRMLLNHSSGLSGRHFRRVYSDAPNITFYQELVEYTNQQGLNYEPGKFHVYCNDAFSFADYIVVLVSKMSFPDYCREYILKPLEMNYTDFPDHILDDFVHPMNQFGTDYQQEYLNGIGMGGIYSSSEDLCLFLDGIITRKLINETSYQELTTLYTSSFAPIDDTTRRFGLGLDNVAIELFKSLGLKAISKGGATFGYLAQALFIPELQLSIGVNIGSDNGESSYIAQKVVYDYLMSHYQYPIKQELDDISEDIEEIEGLYVANEAKLLKLTKQDQHYRAEIYNTDTREMEYKDNLYLENNYLCTKQEQLLGYQNGKIGFISNDENTYLFIEYPDKIEPSIMQRNLIRQKVEAIRGDYPFASMNKKYIKINEDPYQRDFGYVTMMINTQKIEGYANMIIYPYPLKIIDEHTAIPFLEIPGDGSREMTKVQLFDDHYLYNGDYLYMDVDLIQELNLEIINDDYTHYYHYVPFEVDGDFRIIGLDEMFKVIYDSRYSEQFVEGICYIGFVGKGIIKRN